MTKRNEFFIREDLINCYNELLIFNSSNDISLNKTQIKKKISRINKELKILFKEYGRVVNHDEVQSWIK